MTTTTDLRTALAVLPLFAGTTPTSDARDGIVITSGELLINQLVCPQTRHCQPDQ